MAKTIIELMDDMHLSSQDPFLAYYYAMVQGNVSYANTILASNPDLANQIMEANNINILLNKVNELEIIPKEDIDYYLDNLLKEYFNLIDNTIVKGQWSQDVQYQPHNLVYYQNKGYFAYTQVPPPIGTVPTNTQYWREYDIKGKQGYGGIDINFKYSWNSNENYTKGDAVIYQNKLWYAIADNTKFPPNLNHYPWVAISMPKQPNRTPIQKATPRGDYDIGDFWWKITEGDEIVTTIWIIRQPEPTPRFASSGFTIGNNLYIVGGILSNFTRTNINEAYDSLTGTWSSKTPMPTIRARGGSFSIGDNGYVVGGINENGEFLNINECYDSTTNTWSTKAILPTTMIPIATSADNLGYVLGGEIYTLDTGDTPIADSYSYNPATNTWDMITNKPTATRGHTLEADSSVIYAIGGMDSNEITLGNTEAYDIATNTWSQKAQLNVPRSYLASFLSLGEIFAFGGLNSTWYSMSTNERYNIDENKWTIDIPMNYPRSSLNGLLGRRRGYAIGGVNMDTTGIFGYNEQYNIFDDTISFSMVIDTSIAESAKKINTEEGLNIVSEDNEYIVSEGVPLNTISIPMVEGGTYRYYIDWGDGTTSLDITSYNDPNATHTYDEVGEYVINLIGTLDELKFHDRIATCLKEVTRCTLNLRNIDSMFLGCTNLTSVPSTLFDSSLNVTSANSTFKDCSKLSIVPTALFSNNTNITSFKSTFENSGLTSIPTNFFGSNNLVTSFNSTFKNCSSLVNIPANLFANCDRNKDFTNVFSGCSLLKTLPNNLFNNNPVVTSYDYAFYNCTNLTSLPDSLFGGGLASANSLISIFANTALSTLSEGLFSRAVLAENYNNAFENVNVTTIPNRCFNGNNASSVNTFDKSKLVSVGDNGLAGLDIGMGYFEDATNLVSIGNYFSGEQNSYIKTMQNMFLGCSNLKDIGNIRIKYNSLSFVNTFVGCEALENLGTINVQEDPFVPAIGQNVSFIDCTKLTHESLINISNSLVQMTPSTIKTLTLSTESLALLTDIEKLEIINKYWNLPGYTVPTITADIALNLVKEINPDKSSSKNYANSIETSLYYYIREYDVSNPSGAVNYYAVDKETGYMYERTKIPQEEYYIKTDTDTAWVPKGLDGDKNSRILRAKLREDNKYANYQLSNIQIGQENSPAYHTGINGSQSLFGLCDGYNEDGSQRHFYYLNSFQLKDSDGSPTDMNSMFYNCFQYEAEGNEGESPTIDFDNIKFSNVKDMSFMFYSCSRLTNTQLNFLENVDTSNCTQMPGLFNGTSITSMIHINMDSVENSARMYSRTNITEIKPNYLGTKIKDVSFMFSYCKSLASLPSDYTSVFGKNNALQNASFVFSNCSSLKNIGVHNVFDYNETTDEYTLNEEKLNNQLFTYCPNVENLNEAFNGTAVGADSNNKGIPQAVFYHCRKLKTIAYAFMGCDNLSQNTRVEQFCSVFTKNNPELEDISGLFAYAKSPEGVITESANSGNFLFPGTKIKKASRCFYSYGISDSEAHYNIPFVYNSKVLTDVSNMFDGTFAELSGSYSAFTDLSRMFNNRNYSWSKLNEFCPALTNCTGLFASNKNLTGNGNDLVSVLSKISTLTQHDETFKDCTKLSDYNSIPDDWK